MVKWTAHAKTQLHHIFNYISQDSLIYAKRVTQELVQKTLVLNKLPRLGRMTPELEEDTVRELGLYSYRIIYEIKSAQLTEILAVVHKRRNLLAEDIPRNQQ